MSILDDIKNAASYVDQNFADMIVSGYAKSHDISEKQAKNILILLGNTTACKLDENRARRVRDEATINQALTRLKQAASKVLPTGVKGIAQGWTTAFLSAALK